MAEPHWLMTVPELDAAVAVFVPVADVSVNGRELTSRAAFDLAATFVVTSARSVIPAGGVKAVVAELVPFRAPFAVNSRPPGVEGVMDGARTSG